MLDLDLFSLAIVSSGFFSSLVRSDQLASLFCLEGDFLPPSSFDRNYSNVGGTIAPDGDFCKCESNPIFSPRY